MNKIYKYPRTHHVKGSKKQYGDDDLNYVSLDQYKSEYIVVEEKLDGANCAISLSEDGEMLLQSRGHFLYGGPREEQFNLFKSWATAKQNELFDLLKDRYIMYGEWLYAKHTIFYTKLPHYFMEFDIFDKKENIFLNTKRRRSFLSKVHCVVSVPVLDEGIGEYIKPLEKYLKQSLYIDDNHMDILEKICHKRGLDFNKVKCETDNSVLAEGLYLKIEDNEKVIDRLKYVRSTFLTTILDSDSHWVNRPIIQNQLAPNVEIFK